MIEKFTSILKTFYENIKIDAILFFVKLNFNVFTLSDNLDMKVDQMKLNYDDNEKSPMSIQVKCLVKSRKLLHFLINEESLKEKPLILICNDQLSSSQNSQIKMTKIIEEEIKNEIKGILKWEEIQNLKEIFLINLLNYADYDKIWIETTKLINQANKT